MTREEAIRELKQFSGTTRLRLSANFWEALNTVIKALEQETVPREHYEHEFFLRKELDFKVARLEKQIAEQPPCEDCVSRQSVVDFLENHAKDFDDTKVRMAFRAASSLVENADNVPAVIPTHKKGKWIPCRAKYDNMVPIYECSICHKDNGFEDTKYCPNCGAEMESEQCVK